MLYSTKYKFIYLAPPKTSSTSLSRVLIDEFGAESNCDRHDNQIPPEISHYFTFTSIRNPYRRAISGYSHLLRKGIEVTPANCWRYFHMISLAEYLTNTFRFTDKVTLNTLTKNHKIATTGPRVDSYIQVENLENSFMQLPFVDKEVKIPKLNVSEVEVPKDVAQAVCFGVAALHISDFKQFGYELEPPDDLCAFTNGKLPILC